MKKLISLLVFIIILASVSGCQNKNSIVKSVAKDGNENQFPKFLAGTWKTARTDVSADAKWTIVLSPDGTVSSAFIPTAGGTLIHPNQITKFQMLDGSFSTVTAGDCPVAYDPAERELTVEIKITDIHIKFGDIHIDGNSTDVFAGKVSEDGKTWLPDWINVFDYGPKFPSDVNDAARGILPFEKVSK